VVVQTLKSGKITATTNFCFLLKKPNLVCVSNLAKGDKFNSIFTFFKHDLHSNQMAVGDEHSL
jgi:hypothetical protein